MMKLFDLLQRRPEVFFRALSLITLLGALAVWGRVDFINAYDLHLTIYHGLSGVVISLLFLLVSGCYGWLSRPNRSFSPRRMRWHLLISLAGPLGSLPVFLLGRKIALPITDLLQYAADMQFNDRLMLVSIGLWLITLLRQAIFLIQFFKVFRHSNE